MVEQARAGSALGKASLIAGAAQRYVKLTVDYTATRHQFGRPLSRFQAVRQEEAQWIGEVAVSPRPWTARSTLWRPGGPPGSALSKAPGAGPSVPVSNPGVNTAPPSTVPAIPRRARKSDGEPGQSSSAASRSPRSRTLACFSCASIVRLAVRPIRSVVPAELGRGQTGPTDHRAPP